jgi:hypothetical protein
LRGKDGDWIDVEDELPPCDGTYEITNFPENEIDWLKRTMTATGYYDGYGFGYLGVYRTPKYWRKYSPIEKRYGKIKTKDGAT